MNEFEVTPLLRMHARQLQELPAPAGKFSRNGPEGPGNAEIVGGKDPGCDNRRNGRPEFNQEGRFNVLP